MAYTFSFNSPPPSGFSLNPATGLITIAANASPFTGNLSVRVSDGVSSVVKSIPIALTAPTITPLLSTVSRVSHRGGGRVMAGSIDINPVLHRGGGTLAFAVLDVAPFVMNHPGGRQRIATYFEDATPIGVVECRINQGSGSTLAVGQTVNLTTQVTIDNSTVGVNQAVTWSIDTGLYSSYGTVSPTGVVTVTNGTFIEGDAIFTVRATSVAYPNKFDTYEVYAIDRFDSIQVTPSATSVMGGQQFTIASLLVGAGQDLNGSNTQYINVTINEGGNYTYLSGSNVSYTAGATASTISISASYYYASSGSVVNGSTSVQNTGGINTSGLTIVPNYTVTHTGDTNYASLDWASLNDGSDSTGVATGTYYTTHGDVSIVVDLGSPKLIKKIAIAGGYLGGSWGDTIAQYLNGGYLEYSTNGSTWINYSAISDVVDSSGIYKEYQPNITARYWRIRRLEWCATSAFSFYT